MIIVIIIGIFMVIIFILSYMEFYRPSVKKVVLVPQIRTPWMFPPLNIDFDRPSVKSSFGPTNTHPLNVSAPEYWLWL